MKVKVSEIRVLEINSLEHLPQSLPVNFYSRDLKLLCCFSPKRDGNLRGRCVARTQLERLWFVCMLRTFDPSVRLGATWPVRRRSTCSRPAPERDHVRAPDELLRKGQRKGADSSLQSHTYDVLDFHWRCCQDGQTRPAGLRVSARGQRRCSGKKRQVQECREIISLHPAWSGELTVHFG